MLTILYQDDHLIAIHKPHGLLVHRSSLAADATTFAIQILRDQVGRRVYPCHRLDRKTSGVLLFTLDKHTQRIVNQLFERRDVTKKYLAIVRGWTEDRFIIDCPLKREDGSFQEAITEGETLERTEIDLPFGRYDTQRYSLIELKPHTGRMHQLRRHMAHIRHPIIGDRPHGCNKQNRLFLQKWNMNTMMLHAAALSLPDPFNILIQSAPSEEFIKTMRILRFGVNI